MSKKHKTLSQEFIEKASLEAAKEAQRLLYDAEENMALANILIMLEAIKMTPEIYKLKTVQKYFTKILEHYNEAAEHLDEVGFKGMYQELHEENGVELAFKDFDMKKLFDVKPFKIRV